MDIMKTGIGEVINDDAIIARYKKDKMWGLMVSVDLGGCDHEKITSEKVITRFVIELAEFIGMKRFGDPVVVNFGEDEKVSGYSLVQLIETSLISGHFADNSDRAFIDIFSCKEFHPSKAAEFCKEYFGGTTMEYAVTLRD